MTRSRKDTIPSFCADRSFPYVLVCSTLGTIVSLVGVWIITSLAVAPVVA